MNYQTTTLLKTVSVQVPPNTNVGTNGLTISEAANIQLPAGTLLESGNVRIPYDTQENREDNLELEKINNDDQTNDGAATGTPQCNNQNVIYFTDINNKVYSTIPSDLPDLPINDNNQVCYCKLSTDTKLKLNNYLVGREKNININLSEAVWLTLNKETRVKICKDKEVEFRVNGSWHRIKLIKDEIFKI